ncbi:MAG: autotransporter domain-containing protein [Parachlamydiaceae bacterium]|nr:autotransporter domain-containing protein [Parachlamydiaceae bacterium]
MRKFIVPFMTSLLSCSAVFAFWPEAADSSLEVGVGYRRDKFHWETNNSLVNDVPTRSKIEWRDLNIWQIGIGGKYVTCDNLYFRGYADYGWITSGKARNTEFAIGDSSISGASADFNSSSNSSNRSKKGHVYDASLAVGYVFKLCDDSFGIAPVLGYSWHGQHLNLNSFTAPVVGDSSLSSESGSSSKNKFNTRWNGPFLGLDFDYRFCCEWSVFASYEYHWARYHAKTHFNIDPTVFDGFNQSSKKANGSIANLGIKWDFCECWTLGLVGQWQWFTARHGHNRERFLLLDDESSNEGAREECFRISRVKSVKWQSASINLTVGMIF